MEFKIEKVKEVPSSKRESTIAYEELLNNFVAVGDKHQMVESDKVTNDTLATALRRTADRLGLKVKVDKRNDDVYISKGK